MRGVSDAVAPLDVTAERGKNVATKRSCLQCWVAVYKSRLANAISGGNPDRMTSDCIPHSLGSDTLLADFLTDTIVWLSCSYNAIQLLLSTSQQKEAKMWQR